MFATIKIILVDYLLAVTPPIVYGYLQSLDMTEDLSIYKIVKEVLLFSTLTLLIQVLYYGYSSTSILVELLFALLMCALSLSVMNLCYKYRLFKVKKDFANF